jgi:hypothetical protein
VKRTRRSVLVLVTCLVTVLTGVSAVRAAPASRWPIGTLLCGGGLLRMSHSISGTVDCGARLEIGVCRTVAPGQYGYRDVTNQYPERVYVWTGINCPENETPRTAYHNGRLLPPNPNDPSFSFKSFVRLAT